MLYIITEGNYELIETVVDDILHIRNDIALIHTGKIKWNTFTKIK